MSMLKSDICEISSVKSQVSNAYVDRWDILNNLCLHVYAQMSLFMEIKCNHCHVVFFYNHHHNHRAGSQLETYTFVDII